MLQRKNRRKIERKVRGEISRPKKKKNRILRHLDLTITNRFTRATTYCLIIFEFVFIIWWLQSLLLEWQDILVKLTNIINIIKG